MMLMVVRLLYSNLMVRLLYNNSGLRRYINLRSYIMHLCGWLLGVCWILVRSSILGLSILRLSILWLTVLRLRVLRLCI